MNEKKQSENQLQKQVIILALGLIVVPIVVTTISIAAVRSYYLRTMGENLFYSRMDQQILQTFIMDVLITSVLILIVSVFFLRKWIQSALVDPINIKIMRTCASV